MCRASRDQPALTHTNRRRAGLWPAAFWLKRPKSPITPASPSQQRERIPIQSSHLPSPSLYLYCRILSDSKLILRFQD
ncbi:hypothetical protein SLA2020_292770 [Shorea laevis]